MLLFRSRDALLGKDTPLRQVLDVVTQYERGAWDEANETAAKLGLDTFDLRTVCHRALASSSELTLTAAA